MMSTSISIKGQQLVLLPQKAIIWSDRSTLLVSDLHLGKAGHFRKSGIPISSEIHTGELDQLASLISEYQISRIIITGDLFHSEINNEWLKFSQFTSGFPNVRFILVAGNHDILENLHYENAGLEVHSESFSEGPFTFIHDLPDSDEISIDTFYIAGHVHPMLRLSGKGKQSVRLPCFYHTQHYLLLPSYGRFTGGHTMRPGADDQVFVVADGTVLEV